MPNKMKTEGSLDKAIAEQIRLEKKNDIYEKVKSTRKEEVDLSDDIGKSVVSQMQVVIPAIYYWEDVENGKSVMMTMAFKIRGKNYGMAYPIDDQNFVKIDMMRKKLFNVVKESLDVLLHHGDKILDDHGNIVPDKVMDEEAVRWKHDKYWGKKVAAFNKLVRVMPITSAKAMQLGLLDKPQLLLAS